MWVCHIIIHERTDKLGSSVASVSVKDAKGTQVPHSSQHVCKRDGGGLNVAQDINLHIRTDKWQSKPKGAHQQKETTPRKKQKGSWCFAGLGRCHVINLQVLHVWPVVLAQRVG